MQYNSPTPKSKKNQGVDCALARKINVEFPPEVVISRTLKMYIYCAVMAEI